MCRDHPHKRPPPVSDHELFTFWRVRLLCDYRLITVLLSVLFLFFLFLFLFFFFFFFFLLLLLLLWLLLQSEKVILWETQLTIRSLHNYLSIQWHFHFWTVVSLKQKKTLSVFAKPDINTRGVGRIRDSHANLRRCREFSQPLEYLYQAMQILGKRVFYCFYELTFPGKNAKLFVMALIKRETLTSREVLYTESCARNQVLFCKKDALQNTDFSR